MGILLFIYFQHELIHPQIIQMENQFYSHFTGSEVEANLIDILQVIKRRKSMEWLRSRSLLFLSTNSASSLGKPILHLAFTPSEIQLLNIYLLSISMNNLAILWCSFPINSHEFLYQVIKVWLAQEMLPYIAKRRSLLLSSTEALIGWWDWLTCEAKLRSLINLRSHLLRVYDKAVKVIANDIF